MSQSLAEKLCNKSAVLEPDAGDEYAVIGCDPAHVLQLWRWRYGVFRQCLFSFHARQKLGDHALDERAVSVLSHNEGALAGGTRLIRQVRSICSFLVIQPIGSSCLRGSRIRVKYLMINLDGFEGIGAEKAEEVKAVCGERVVSLLENQQTIRPYISRPQSISRIFRGVKVWLGIGCELVKTFQGLLGTQLVATCQRFWTPNGRVRTSTCNYVV